jgi:hypothetical protein
MAFVGNEVTINTTLWGLLAQGKGSALPTTAAAAR